MQYKLSARKGYKNGDEVTPAAVFSQRNKILIVNCFNC